MKCYSALILAHPLSGRFACAPTVRWLSNWGAGVAKGRKWARVEENSGVQKMEERLVRCGEINSSRGCGEGHAWEGMEADDLLCSRNARSRTPLVGRAQWKINQPPSLKR